MDILKELDQIIESKYNKDLPKGTKIFIYVDDKKVATVKGKNVKSALAKYKKDNPKIEYKNIEATIEEK